MVFRGLGVWARVSGIDHEQLMVFDLQVNQLMEHPT